VEEVFLVVDDEEMNRNLLKHSLERRFQKGHVIVAENGMEALNILRTIRVDVVISDIRMPRMTGTELFMVLQEDGDGCMPPFIFVSGGGSVEEEAIANTAKGFFLKPYRSNELCDAARRAMH
jgi:two-component system, response regulator YesN